MTTSRTFYTVNFRTWGVDRDLTACFEDKNEAEKFADQDYHDKVVSHRVSKEDTIKKYEEMVQKTTEYQNM
ncbi:MAG: hypothetical protein Q4G60_03170 [bacterium]|nr:hypothetical protein [bacterium]